MTDATASPTAAAAPDAPAENEEALYHATFRISGNDYEHGGEAATKVKAILRELRLAPDVIRRVSIANFEAEMNLIMYADEGDLDLTVTDRAVRVTLADRGPGIPDIDLAMQEGYSTATAEMRARGFGAGMGLPNIRRNTDRFEIESTPGEGTTLRYVVRLSA